MPLYNSTHPIRFKAMQNAKLKNCTNCELNIIENSGLHLIYSQFRTLEGIGIFSMVLDQNGFAQFKIAQDKDNIWRIIVRPGDEDKPKYALYTGTETREVKEMMRLIFNGDWEKLPDSIKEVLNETAANNNHGEIIKVFIELF
jgi:hypothetical protein